MGNDSTLVASAQTQALSLPGRKPISDRQDLTGILFVLKGGIPWEMLPQEMGCGSGMTLRLRSGQVLLTPAAGLAGGFLSLPKGSWGLAETS